MELPPKARKITDALVAAFDALIKKTGCQKLSLRYKLGTTSEGDIGLFAMAGNNVKLVWKTTSPELAERTYRIHAGIPENAAISRY